MKLVKNESKDDDSNTIVVEKCAKYCEKINEQIQLANSQITTDEDSACPKEVEQETREEMIYRTMRYLLKERKEIKVFRNFALTIDSCLFDWGFNSKIKRISSHFSLN